VPAVRFAPPVLPHRGLENADAGLVSPFKHMYLAWLMQGKMELARDMATEMAARGEGVVLDQFGNADNPLAHFNGTGAPTAEAPEPSWLGKSWCDSVRQEDAA